MKLGTVRLLGRFGRGWNTSIAVLRPSDHFHAAMCWPAHRTHRPRPAYDGPRQRRGQQAYLPRPYGVLGVDVPFMATVHPTIGHGVAAASCSLPDRSAALNSSMSFGVIGLI